MVTFPINFPFFGVMISSHLVFDLLAYSLFFHFYLYMRKKKGDFLSFHTRTLLFLGALAGAFIGSRLLAALESPALFFHPPSFLYYFIGQTVLGGLAGGIIGVELVKLFIGEKRSTGDLLVFPMMLGIIVGRIGCFLTGVSDRTVGLASSLPWAFDQGDGIARHPTSLYEIIFLLMLWFFLYRFSTIRQLTNGVLFKCFAFSYFGFRFLIEFIKPLEPLFLSLSALQWVSLCGVLYYGKALLSEYVRH